MNILKRLYSDEFFVALNAWQNGWQEDQEKRNILAEVLSKESEKIPKIHHKVDSVCYRKVFLIKSDMSDLFLKGGKREGITSWTTSEDMAKDFKGILREGAICAAIFKHKPIDNEIILNIPSLWSESSFVSELTHFLGEKKAIENFRDSQFEIVMNVPLRNQEIVFLSGVSSSFEYLCDLANITDEKIIDEAWRFLISNKMQPESPTYIDQKRAQNVLNNVKAKFLELYNQRMG